VIGLNGSVGVLWEILSKHTKKSPKELRDEWLEEMDNYHLGKVSLQSALDHFGMPLTEEEFLEKIEAKATPYEDFLENIDRLKENFGRIIVITENSPTLMKRKMGDAGIEKYFDATYSTHELKGGRKNVASYRDVADIEGVHPKEIVHIGDKIRRDYILPTEAKYHAILIHRNGLDQDYFQVNKVAENIHDVVDILLANH